MNFCSSTYVAAPILTINCSRDWILYGRNPRYLWQFSSLLCESMKSSLPITLMCHLAKNQVTWLNVMQGSLPITLMCHLAKNQVTWLNVMQGVDLELRETSIRLLAFIVGEGLIYTQDNTRESMFLQCPPIQKENLGAHEKP